MDRLSQGPHRRLLVSVPLLTVLSLGVACTATPQAPPPVSNRPSVGTSAAPAGSPTPSSAGSASGKPSATPSKATRAPQTKPSSSKPSSSKQTPAPDPTAPSKIAPAGRSKSVASRVKASAGTFRKPVRWRDDLSLEVVSIRQGKTSGEGRGAQPGQPQTTFGLELTNNSAKTVKATAAVVTATYLDGSTTRVAAPIYSPTTADFANSVKPNANATASYAFSLPTKRGSVVTVTVDLDAKHELARFAGPVAR